MEMIRVLFVCTGNICRSPTAEGVFQSLVAAERLSDKIEADSAGIENYHVGDPPDTRSTQAAFQRGYSLEGLRARRVLPNDFKTFDLILAMDSGHAHTLKRLSPLQYQDKIKLFLDFAPNFTELDVPDPYYGDASGFQTVLDMVEDGARGLLDHLRRHFDL